MRLRGCHSSICCGELHPRHPNPARRQTRREAEWEEQVGSLELKQLKLMRAQISTTLREIAEMRDDFISLARKQASLERGLADVDAKHSQKSVDIRTWEPRWRSESGY